MTFSMDAATSPNDESWSFNPATLFKFVIKPEFPKFVAMSLTAVVIAPSAFANIPAAPKPAITTASVPLTPSLEAPAATATATAATPAKTLVITTPRENKADPSTYANRFAASRTVSTKLFVLPGCTSMKDINTV